MRQQPDAFEQLQHKTARLLQDVAEEPSIREAFERVTADESSEIEAAAEVHASADMLSKYYKRIKTEAAAFLKHGIPEGKKIELGRYSINHYTRSVFDNTAWEHHVKHDSDLAPLYYASQELDQKKKSLKENFQHLDSSVRVTRKEQE